MLFKSLETLTVKKKRGGEIEINTIWLKYRGVKVQAEYTRNSDLQKLLKVSGTLISHSFFVSLFF